VSRGGGRGLILGVLLFASVATAWGEGECVLWSGVRQRGAWAVDSSGAWTVESSGWVVESSGWAVESAAKDLKTCRYLGELFTDNDAALRRLPPEQRAASGYRAGRFYVCFPDTVNLGGPKAK